MDEFQQTISSVIQLLSDGESHGRVVLLRDLGTGRPCLQHEVLLLVLLHFPLPGMIACYLTCPQASWLQKSPCPTCLLGSPT